MAQLSPRDETKLRHYEEILAREPHALVFAALASLYARKYDFPSAIEVLAKGLESFPNYFSARVLLAKCYIALDRFDEAVTELETVLAADPYNLSALGLLGDELRNRGRLGDARERYLKIIEFEPENEEYAYKLELLDALTEGSPFGETAEQPSRPEITITAPPAARFEPPPARPAPRKVEMPPARRVVEVPPTPSEIEMPPAPRFELPPEPPRAAPVPEPKPRPRAEAEPPTPPPKPRAEAPPTAAPAPPRREEPPVAAAEALDLVLVEEAGVRVEDEEAAAAFADELATLTLAKIYEDQGLFVRAREIIQKVLAHEPGNADARAALDHVAALIASERSPTGASIIQLIKKVGAVAGLLERDDLELWAEVSAGVEEALTGYEELTVAQAVAAAAGVVGEDFFTVPEGLPARWEFELPGVAGAEAAAGADELELDMPLFRGFTAPSGVNTFAVKAPPGRGAGGQEEFELGRATAAAQPVPPPRAAATPATAAAQPVPAPRAAATPPIRRATPKPPPPPLPQLELEAEPDLPLEAGPVTGPDLAVETPPDDELSVRPERYRARRLLEPEKDPFRNDKDFLGWLDAIKLKGI